MQTLLNSSNLRWLGFYLPVTGPGLADKLTWVNNFGVLRNMGWGVAPIYVGKQPNSHGLLAKRGEEQLNGYMDGIEAAIFASREGIPLRTVIYLDQEIPSQDKPWLDYCFGWVKAVIDQKYVPGIYCSYTIGNTLIHLMTQRSPDARPEIWVWNVDKYPAHHTFANLNDIPIPDPTKSGSSMASSWQYVHGSSIRLPGIALSPVDFNSSNFSDPGQRTIDP
jgi:hypothetical protein